MTFVHQAQEHALAEHRVFEVQACELVLARLRLGHVQLVEDPVVELAIVLELERAHRVGDAFDGVRQAVREVVQGVDAPIVPGTVMVCAADSVQQRIAHQHVRRRHVDSCAQHVRSVLELTRAHAPQKVQALVGRPVPVRAGPPGLGDRAPERADLFLGRRVHVGLAVFDEALGITVELLEVVRGMKEVVAHVETQPPDVALHGLDVSLVLGRRVRVVETKVGRTAVFGGGAEVQANGLRMSNVQEAVRLGRETRDDLPAVRAGRHIVLDDGSDEVQCLGRVGVAVAHSSSPTASAGRESSPDEIWWTVRVVGV